MSRLEVFYDIDGVLSCSSRPVLKLMNKELGTHFTEKNILHYGWVFEKTKEMSGSDDLAGKVQGAWYDPEVLLQAKPYRGAVLVTMLIRAMGIGQAVVTTRRPEMGPSTKKWIARYFGQSLEDDLVFIRHYDDASGGVPTSLTGSDFKASVLALHRPRLFFDDDADIVRAVRPRVPSRICLVDRPWNRTQDSLDELRVRWGWLGIALCVLAEQMKKAAQKQ